MTSAWEGEWALDQPLDFVPQGDQAPQQFRQEANGYPGVLFGHIVPPAADTEAVLVTRPDDRYLAFGIGNRCCLDHLYIASGVIHAHLDRSSIQSAVVFHRARWHLLFLGTQQTLQQRLDQLFQQGRLRWMKVTDIRIVH